MRWVLGLCLVAMTGWGFPAFYEIYPPTLRALDGTRSFEGDRHQAFAGDLVARLSDGSEWKVRPQSRRDYESWIPGEPVSVQLRPHDYLFKREHHFFLVNHVRNSFVKAMMVTPRHVPNPTVIVDSETFVARTELRSEKKVIVHRDGDEETLHTTRTDPVWRQRVTLSDGSQWVLRDTSYPWHPGTVITVGHRGQPNRYYNFVLIAGDQREVLTREARPYFVDHLRPSTT
ncbi:MAG: hypothetical protein ACOYKZ_06935, partial [Chlamydiia bacterium]